MIARDASGAAAYARGMDVESIDEIVRRALSEDVGTGDVTTAATVPAGGEWRRP